MKKIRLGGVAALILALAAFACLFLRGGVRMEFLGRPENVVRCYPFYDSMPIGYGNWFPWLTIFAGTGAAVSAFLVAFCGARQIPVDFFRLRGGVRADRLAVVRLLYGLVGDRLRPVRAARAVFSLASFDEI